MHDDLNDVLAQMHIVSKRKDLTLEEAVNTSDGLAVLGFFIEVTLISCKNVLTGINFNYEIQNHNNCVIKNRSFIE